MSFTILDFVILLIIAGFCGALGQVISGTSRGGILASIALGFIGALFGLWLARLMELGSAYVIAHGWGTTRDLEFTEAGGRLEGADPDRVSDLLPRGEH